MTPHQAAPARSRSVHGWTIPGPPPRGVSPRFDVRGETSVSVLGCVSAVSYGRPWPIPGARRPGPSGPRPWVGTCRLGLPRGKVVAHEAGVNARARATRAWDANGRALRQMPY